MLCANKVGVPVSASQCLRHLQTGQVQGFPGLVDEGETVGLRIFDTEAAARTSHEQGLVRLFRLAMNKELKYLRKNLPFTPAIELAYR